MVLLARSRPPTGPFARRAALASAILALALFAAGTVPALAGLGTVRAHPDDPAAVLGSGSSSSTGYGYCSSSGTEWLGVDWNCVAILNLTEVLLLLGGIGIILYVFRDSDAAELPGDDSEVPLTEEDWQRVRDRRTARLGPTRSTADPKGGSP